MKLKLHLIAVSSAAMLASLGTYAAGNAGTDAAPAPTAAERRDAVAGNEEEQLETKLRAGQSRADYARILQSNGYRIAAINQDKPDNLEYEVVKGDRSYEVQIEFKAGAARATNVDVAPNLWRADATKRMLADAKYKDTRPLAADPEGRFSDKRYKQAWTDEKNRLEQALPPNLKVSEYRSKIESLGYKVTAVNDRDRNHVEYEIAKGDNSYEVKIDVDPQSQTAKDIDVTSNLWEADSTDRVTDRAAPRRN